MELNNREIGFVKGFLSSEDSKKTFCDIFEKAISELKDIENLPKDEPLEVTLKIRLAAVEVIRNVIRSLVVITSQESNPHSNI